MRWWASHIAGGRVQPRAVHRPSRAASARRWLAVTVSRSASSPVTWPVWSSRTREIRASHSRVSIRARVAGPVQAAVAHAHSAGTPGEPGSAAATVSANDAGRCAGQEVQVGQDSRSACRAAQSAGST
jgi:hypothetical protein